MGVDSGKRRLLLFILFQETKGIPQYPNFWASLLGCYVRVKTTTTASQKWPWWPWPLFWSYADFGHRSLPPVVVVPEPYIVHLACTSSSEQTLYVYSNTNGFINSAQPMYYVHLLVLTSLEIEIAVWRPMLFFFLYLSDDLKIPHLSSSLFFHLSSSNSKFFVYFFSCDCFSHEI